VDVRIIAATNRNLAEAVRAGRFRQDLYYRLAVMTIELPPLRERRTDIVGLAEHFLDKHRRELNREIVEGFTDEALRKLENYDWPGNIRELDNVVQRAVILAPSRHIGADVLRLESPSAGVAEGDGAARPFVDAKKRFETVYFLDLMRRAAGNVTRAAELAGMHRSTVHTYLKELKIDDAGGGNSPGAAS
jgi:DNA-binding NtrC family response regulator